MLICVTAFPAMRLFPALLLSGFLALPSFSGASSPTGLDRLEEKARESKVRLKTGPARRTVRATTATGARFGVRVVSAPPDFEARILLKPDSNKPQPFARIVAHSGKWAVEEFGGLKGIYLPWEAPFSYEVVALLLSEAWPPAYVRGKDHTLRGRIGDTLVIRAPLSAAQRAVAESFLEDADIEGVEPRSELARNLAAIRLRLQEGNRLRVDPETGLMEHLVLGDLELEYSRIEWLEEQPDIPVLKSYPDFSAPLPGDRDGLVMIGRSGAWRPGYPELDAGGQLLNLDTGKVIRIPFAGSSCLPGCFTDGRSKVVVTSRESDGSGVGLYLVDLLKGTQMKLGGGIFTGGICAYPALSSDGKSLAVTFSRDLLQRRVYLLSPDNEKPRPLGQSLDIRSLSWLGDGRALILLVVDPAEEGGSGSGFRIVRLGLDGEVSEVRNDIGKFATVSGKDADRIFFQGRDKLWYTCDSDGQDVSMVGNGLDGLEFPAVNPEGTHAVMIERDEENQSWPVVVELVTGKKFPVKVERGRWLLPAWR